MHPNNPIYKRPITIFHTTSPECAFDIVRNGFRVPSDMIAGDQCVNFHNGKLHEGMLAFLPENKGCTMKFEWVGDQILDIVGRPIKEMEPNILHIQIEGGRFILRPGTNNGLEFLQVDFDKDAPASRSNYRKEKCEFIRAAGRTIPVGYSIGAAREAAQKPGLFKTMINRLIG